MVIIIIVCDISVGTENDKKISFIVQIRDSSLRKIYCLILSVISCFVVHWLHRKEIGEMFDVLLNEHDR